MNKTINKMRTTAAVVIFLTFIFLPLTFYPLTRDEMQECQSLKPLLVGQIEFTEWTPDGHLLHSSFTGLRDDKKA